MLINDPTPAATSSVDVVILLETGPLATGGPFNGRVHLSGGVSQDHLVGGSGDDLLAGGKGKDRCSGGTGEDKFRSCEKIVSP